MVFRALRHKFTRAKELGYPNALQLVVRWKIHRWKNYKAVTLGDDWSVKRIRRHLVAQEEIVRAVLSSCTGQSFLEIGIGSGPRIERMQLILDNEIRYTGCDFKSVCSMHQKELELRGMLGDKIRFVGNEVGTYSWTLFEFMQSNEQFDVIFIDGHHTFYVDLPAFILAHYLLKPGGYLLIDDITWTLSFLRRNLAQNFGEWCFYRNMYDFSQYDKEQQNIPHVEMIAEGLLLSRMGYSKVEKYSIPYRWLLQKPEPPL
jgi:predicted O-methyltransferase YrrM